MANGAMSAPAGTLSGTAFAIPKAFTGVRGLDEVLLGMPGMDGYEMARRLRSVCTDKKVSIVALTGYGQDADRTKSAETGLDAHLVKPLEPSALDAVIASLSREAS